MSDERLKPCPFCGGEAKKTYFNFLPAVQCKRCKATVFREYREQVNGAEVLFWNTRKPMERIVEKLEEKYKTFICKNTEPCDYPEKIGCCYDRAINHAIGIVKAGGVDEVD